MLVEGNNQLIEGLKPEISQYTIKEFAIAAVKGKKTVISEFNRTDDGFFDTNSSSLFDYDPITGKVSNIQPYEIPSTNYDIGSLSSSLDKYVSEHYPSDVGSGVFPQQDGTVAIVIVDNKYNPSNFWNGRWKSWYILNTSSSGSTLEGNIELDVHYFEDGNVRLKTKKGPTQIQLNQDSPSKVVMAISKFEHSYQDSINKEFVGLNEGPFKALRRQLPVTRSKVNWGKSIGNYRLGKDIGGGGGGGEEEE
jgi:capping protein alpha